MMKIILAGYNLDYDTIRKLQAARPELQNLTPETLSAAYARISRDPRPVNELRAVAREEVEKARQSNRAIVFGLGHSSVAEHAVFNIDVLGVSRLLVEEIERFRLCSYTEKSQRYILLADDAVIPEEVREAGLEKPFRETIGEQNALYHKLYEGLLPHVLEKNPEMANLPANRSTLEGWAKEDARYIVSLATEAQLGMTLNARNLELLLRRLAAHPLQESRAFSRQLYERTFEIAPSLIRYAEPTPFDRDTRSALRRAGEALLTRHSGIVEKESDDDGKGLQQGDVRLIDAAADADDRILAALLHTSSTLSLDRCRTLVQKMDAAEKTALIKEAFRFLSQHDSVLREFEYADLTFELIISASCYAQLKRHRMATLTVQDYDPDLGVTVPSAIVETGMEPSFLEAIAKTEAVYRQIARSAPRAAAYILTNAHRRRAILKVNARELYHMAHLRADAHAQWDIRRITDDMLTLARQAMPLTFLLATGKDGFAEAYRVLFP
ncbi:MAG: FAD-dependent thymidylate synthase [Syntrophus sp. PtaB.Bin001]|nr:MAG: FAD-dependent thymidylate synthase [Syntrophus sp. PtaB.Bin001]